MPYTIKESILRLQSAAMLRDAASGLNYREIAQKYGVSKDTVQRRLSYAERANLFTKHEDTILEGMVPLAEKAILKRLAVEASDSFSEKPEVALKVYDGTRLFKKDAGKSPSQLIPGGEESLDSHIARLRANAAKELETTDAELLPEATRNFLGLPPIAAPASPAGAPAAEGRAPEAPDAPHGDAPPSAGAEVEPVPGEAGDRNPGQPVPPETPA